MWTNNNSNNVTHWLSQHIHEDPKKYDIKQNSTATITLSKCEKIKVALSDFLSELRLAFRRIVLYIYHIVSTFTVLNRSHRNLLRVTYVHRHSLLHILRPPICASLATRAVHKNVICISVLMPGLDTLADLDCLSGALIKILSKIENERGVDGNKDKNDDK